MGLTPNQYQGGNRGGQNNFNQGGYQQRNSNHQGGRGGQRGGRGGGRGGRNNSQRNQSQNGGQPYPQPSLLPLPQVNLIELEELKTPEERKNFVGNAIYPIIAASISAELAGRITGMLIDEKLVNFKDLLTNQQYFNTKCREA